MNTILHYITVVLISILSPPFHLLSWKLGRIISDMLPTPPFLCGMKYVLQSSCLGCSSSSSFPKSLSQTFTKNCLSKHYNSSRRGLYFSFLCIYKKQDHSISPHKFIKGLSQCEMKVLLITPWELWWMNDSENKSFSEKKLQCNILKQGGNHSLPKIATLERNLLEKSHMQVVKTSKASGRDKI